MNFSRSCAPPGRAAPWAFPGPAFTIPKVEPGARPRHRDRTGGAVMNIVVEERTAAKKPPRFCCATTMQVAPLYRRSCWRVPGRLSGTARLALRWCRPTPVREYRLEPAGAYRGNINEASRAGKWDTCHHNVRYHGVTGRSMQAEALPAQVSAAGLLPASRRWKSCALKWPKLQRDRLAAQEKTDQCKEQADALRQADCHRQRADHRRQRPVRAEASKAAGSRRCPAGNCRAERTAADGRLGRLLFERQPRKGGCAAFAAGRADSADEQRTAELSRIAEGKRQLFDPAEPAGTGT